MPSEHLPELAIRPAPENNRRTASAYPPSSSRTVGTDSNGIYSSRAHSNGTNGTNGTNGINGTSTSTSTNTNGIFSGINSFNSHETYANIPNTNSNYSNPSGFVRRSSNCVSSAIPINGSAGRVPGHKHARSSYSDSPSYIPRNSSLSFRPAKRSMATPGKTVAVINASGRQAASLIRYATAVGYHVRAQMRNRLGVMATEVNTNENVTVIEGELYTRLPRSNSDKAKGRLADVDVTSDGPSLSGIGINHKLINELFRGAQLAFINTTFYGDEVKIGEALADAAKKAGIQHFVYSSMPDHNAYDPEWPSLPLWATKHKVEEYIQAIGLPATFVYTGIYNNNFTSLNYPLFNMALQPDGSFLWQAPFHPDAKLPWLDAEHDVGPAILQVFKDGVTKWGGKRVALAYEMLSPREACRLFAQGVGRPVSYRRGPIDINVPIPAGYRTQLKALERLFFFGGDDPTRQPPYFGSRDLDDDVPTLAMELWEGPRGIEEYAREVFPLEEHANGMTWMFEDEDNEEYSQGPDIGSSIPVSPDGRDGRDGRDGFRMAALANSLSAINSDSSNVNDIVVPAQDDIDTEVDDDDDEEGLVMRITARDDEEWLP